MTDITDKIDIVKMAIKKGHFKLIFNEIKRRFYSDGLHYGLRRDLSLPFKGPKPKIDVILRSVKNSDIPILLNMNESDISSSELKDRLFRRSLLKAGVSTSYVAATKDDKPCHIRWVMTSDENDIIGKYFKGGFPKLEPDEVLFEGAYTLSEYRSKSITSHILSRLAEKYRAENKQWAITFILDSNIASLKAVKKAGFMIYSLRKERWRYFRRHVSFTPLPDGFPMPPPFKGDCDK